ncbi:MAG: ligase-associated DNA damage response endonuclease PdeM [Candidatus Promineofilum sp.]|nr:ligase-associated DNA damage response endonuclease PdeM [Promineifilum sp.]
MITTEVRGETLWLLPQRAVYWPRVGALIIADAHFGKAATFRAGGIPVPGGTTAEMLRRLSAALDATAATRLLVLGDLLHARAGRAPEMLAQVAAWHAARPALRVTLIRGNHDSRAGDPPGEWGVECLDAPVVELPFTWHHQPPPVAQDSYPVLPNKEAQDKNPVPQQGYPIAGHVHPAVALGGNGRAMTLPCFYFGRDYALLPAFGEFTGTAVIRPRPGESVFVLAGDEIVPKPV